MANANASASAVLSQPAGSPGVLKVHPPGEGGWLTPAQVAALTPESVRNAIRAIQPMIAAHAGESERLGYPHPAVWDAIRASGFFYHFVPKAYGGCEFGPEDFFLTANLISQACASTGWAATFCCEHNWAGALFPKEAQDRFFAGGRYFIAPLVSTPPAMVTKTEGGYILNAQWKWGSGVMHSDWCMGMALLMDEAGAPAQTITVAVPRDRVTAPFGTRAPAARAKSIPRASAFTTGYVSLADENFATRCRLPSLISALGRAPPIDVPRTKASPSSSGSASPASSAWAADTSWSSVASPPRWT